MSSLFRRLSRQEIVVGILALAALVLAIIHLTNMISTVSRYSLNHAFQDQFRLNLRYLTVPFPLSIFELENGHRPVLPGLARWIELRYLAGTSTLQFISAWVAAVVAVGVLFQRCWSALDWSSRALLFCVVATTVLWNANARMFIHTYEATHLFYIFASLTLALYAVSTEREVTLSATTFACVAGALATFSFGPGIVVYAAVAGVLVLRRAAWQSLVMVIVSALLVFAVYSFVLPGAVGVRASSESVSLLTTSYFVVARIAAFWIELFALQFDSESNRQVIVVALGGSVVGLTLLHVTRAWWARRAFSPATLVGLGLIFFGVVTNALIAFNRTAHFLAIPPELFADRYVFWSALLWLGLATYWLSQPKRPRSAILVLALIIIAASSLAFNQANWWRSWAASTYRVVELTSVALRLGISHDHRLQEVSGLEIAIAQASVDAMRRAQVSTFAPGPEVWLGRKLELAPFTTEIPVAISTDTRDLPRESSWEILGGVMPRVDAHRVSGWQLWVADESGKVIGQCAKTGLRTKSTDYSRYFKPIYNQFDCYVQRGHDDKIALLATRGETVKNLAKLIPVVRDKALIPNR